MKLLAYPVGNPDAAASVGNRGGLAGTVQKMLAQGADGLSKLQVIEPTEAIGVFMRVSLLGGFILALPWIVSEIYLFVAPGLMPRGRIILLLGIPLVSVFFLLGVGFCFFVMLPAAVPFLYNFMGFKTAWRPSAYFDLITTLMFWVGVTFEMPLVAYLLAAVGLIPRQPARFRLAVRGGDHRGGGGGHHPDGGSGEHAAGDGPDAAAYTLSAFSRRRSPAEGANRRRRNGADGLIL